MYHCTFLSFSFSVSHPNIGSIMKHEFSESNIEASCNREGQCLSWVNYFSLSALWIPNIFLVFVPWEWSPHLQLCTTKIELYFYLFGYFNFIHGSVFSVAWNSNLYAEHLNNDISTYTISFSFFSFIDSALNSCTGHLL